MISWFASSCELQAPSSRWGLSVHHKDVWLHHNLDNQSPNTHLCFAPRKISYINCRFWTWLTTPTPTIVLPILFQYWITNYIRESALKEAESSEALCNSRAKIGATRHCLNKDNDGHAQKNLKGQWFPQAINNFNTIAESTDSYVVQWNLSGFLITRNICGPVLWRSHKTRKWCLETSHSKVQNMIVCCYIVRRLGKNAGISFIK